MQREARGMEYHSVARAFLIAWSVSVSGHGEFKSKRLPVFTWRSYDERQVVIGVHCYVLYGGYAS